MERQDGLIDLLAARRYLYNVFNSIFGNEPSSATASLYDASLIGQAFQIVDMEDNEPAAVLVDRLEGGADDFDDMAGLYNRLFVGPGVPVANPWEAMYLSHSERRLFSPIAYAVRQCYRAQGFIPARYPHVSDDALALELAFLAALGERALDAAAREDSFEEPLRASSEFLGDHLLKWSGRCAGAIAADGPNTFYALAALAMDAFLRKDKLLVDELLC